MNLNKLQSILKAEPKYRYAQINKALYQDFVSDWDEISSLPKALREKLKAECSLEIEAQVFKGRGGKGALKALITLDDDRRIETVLIRQKGRRNTVCVSSQVGCPLNCAFCATGRFGFERNLTAEEIIEQVIFWARYLTQEEKKKSTPRTAVEPDKIDNIVFMGMGEPFLNYTEFIKAVKFLNNPETMNIGARRLSVSTAGEVEGIKRLTGEKLQVNLAISLHASNDNLRRDLMPIAKKYALRELFRAVDTYIEKTGRRVMFEYLMIKNINDTDKDAAELGRLLKKPLYMVNLIPYNPTGQFKASSAERIEKFKDILALAGITATVRQSFGGDILAACGQLRGRKKDLAV